MAEPAKEKMCKLAEKGMPKKKFAKYSEIVGGAEYICKKCGRAAASKSNLCKPEKRD